MNAKQTKQLAKDISDAKSLLADNSRGDYVSVLDLLKYMVSAVESLQADNARLRAALEDARHDLVTSDGLYACDNAEGHSLFQLKQRSIAAIDAALEGQQ
jgi:hypothetical protein